MKLIKHVDQSVKTILKFEIGGLILANPLKFFDLVFAEDVCFLYKIPMLLIGFANWVTNTSSQDSASFGLTEVDLDDGVSSEM